MAISGRSALIRLNGGSRISILTTSVMVASNPIKCWMVYRTVKEMTADRGYTTLLAGHTINDQQQFNEIIVSDGKVDKHAMSFTVFNPVSGKTLMVKFEDEESIGIKPITALRDEMLESRVSHCILVYPKSITSPARKFLEKTVDVRIEQFSEDELVINITRHQLMPHHSLLTLAEKKQLLYDTKLKDSQLPRILATDPMAKFLGAKRGDVIRVVRRSETAGRCLMYRLCG